MELKRRAVRGVVGYGSLSFVRFVLSFLTQIAFARLLAPSAFGILTLAAAILTGLTLIGRWGIAEAIMQDTEHEHIFSTVFWLRAGYSLFVVAFVGLFVFLAQGLFAGAVLTALLILTVGKAISSLSTPFAAVMQREFELVRLAIVDLIALVLGAGIGLWLVLNDFGVWGLLVYYMLYDSIFGGAVIALSPKFPRLAFNRDAMRWFVGFAWSLLFSKSLSAVESRADDFAIGTIGGTTMLGIYTIAYRLTEAFSTVFQTTISKGILPTFARIQDSDRKSVRGLSFLLRMQTYVVVPLYMLVAVAATDIITLLFGNAWVDAGPILRVLAPAGVLIPLVASMRQYYYSVGEGRVVLRLQILYLTAFVAGLLLLVPLYGAVGGVIATVFAQLFGFVLFSIRLRSDIGLSFRPIFFPAMKAAIPTVGIVVGLRALGFPWQLWRVLESVPASQLFVPILSYGFVTALIFYSALYVTSPATVREDAEIVRAALTD